MVNPKKLKKNIDILLADVKHSEMDAFIVLDGYEGTGKSFGGRGLGMYCATVLETTFDVKDIEFSTKEYMKNSLKGPKFKINVLDESRKALGKGKTRDWEVQKFLDYISECRSKRQIHILCLPAFHDLSKYLVLWRMGILIHFLKEYVEDDNGISDYKLVRGQFKAYTDQKSLNYCYEHPYQYPKKWDVWDRWSNKEVFTEEQLKAYNQKKDDHMNKKYLSQEKTELNNRHKAAFRRKLIPKLKLKGWTNSDLAELFECQRSSITADLQILSSGS